MSYSGMTMSDATLKNTSQNSLYYTQIHYISTWCGLDRLFHLATMAFGRLAMTYTLTEEKPRLTTEQIQASVYANYFLVHEIIDVDAETASE